MPKPPVLLLGPALGAVSGVTTHLNQLFASDLRDGFELHHFQVGSEGRRESRTGQAIRYLLSPVEFIYRLMVLRPRIVHINTSMEPKSFWRDVVYLLIARAMFRKVVYQIHGGAFPLDFFPNNWFLRRFLRWVLGLPSVVVLLASAELRAYGAFAPAAHLVVVPNAIDVASPSGPKSPPTAHNPLHLAYIGRMAREKGIFEVVAAVRLLLDEGARVVLSFAGSGRDEAELRADVRAARLDDVVKFHGPLFGEQKERLWQAAHVFAFPTYHQEGLPYALLEAMAAGAVPVISPVAAIPDVMQDGVHGIFVRSRDPAAVARAVARLLGDEAERIRMSDACRQRIVDNYRVERLASDFRAIYTLLDRGRPDLSG